MAKTNFKKHKTLAEIFKNFQKERLVLEQAKSVKNGFTILKSWIAEKLIPYIEDRKLVVTVRAFSYGEKDECNPMTNFIDLYTNANIQEKADILAFLESEKLSLVIGEHELGNSYTLSW
jgi:hypothetical protein